MVAALLLTGCSWFGRDEVEDRDPDDYLQSTQLPELKIPRDLEDSRVRDPFPIPTPAEQPQPRFYSDKPPLPNAIYGTDSRDEVRIQRLSGRRWVVAPEAPDTVWPKVKQFLADNGVVVELDAPRRGRLNTQWLEIGSERYRDVIRMLLQDAREKDNVAAGQDRFLLRVEQGVRQRSSEIHVRHENNTLGLPSPDGFDDFVGKTSASEEAESMFLNEVGAYIAAKVAEQVVSMVAQDIGSVTKAVLQRNRAGFPVLNLRLDFDRAWATVGQALDTAEIEVTEADRDSGVFRVALPEDLLNDDEQRSVWRRLIPFSGGQKSQRELKLRLSEAAPPSVDGFDLSVLGPDDQTLDPEFSQQVLVLVKEFAG